MYYQQYQSTAALASERGEFIRKVYMNLALGFVGFIVLEAFLLTWQPAVELAQKMVTGSNWLIVLLAFMGVSWLANSWAVNGTTLGKQYAGFALYIIAESIIFLPLLIFANMFAPDTIPQAGIITAALTAGISAYAFFSKKDFSFLGSFLTIASFVALGIIVCAIIFGMQLGLWFSGAMIIFAGLVVLYQTSAIIRQYQNDQYVAAALGLFAAIALMFWYILQFLISSRR